MACATRGEERFAPPPLSHNRGIRSFAVTENICASARDRVEN